MERSCGLHAVTALLQQDATAVSELWVLASRHDRRLEQILSLAAGKVARIHRVSRGELDQLVPGLRHQGVVVESQGPRPLAEADLDALLDALAEPPLLLVLDGVQDPHNLGACLRSADAAGVHAVIAPRDRAAGLNGTVRKVACGAAESVPFIPVVNLARVLDRLAGRGVWRVGLDGAADTPLFACDLAGPLALVMGGEGKGLRRLTRENCDALASLPMRGIAQSLNVSVATGIALYEAVRQRGEGWVVGSR